MDDVQQALSKLQSYTSSCPLRKGVEKVEEVREHPILQKKRQSLGETSCTISSLTLKMIKLRVCTEV